jgi:hypothetical protein
VQADGQKAFDREDRKDNKFNILHSLSGGKSCLAKPFSFEWEMYFTLPGSG